MSCLLEVISELGVVVYAGNPSIQKLEGSGSELETS